MNILYLLYFDIDNPNQSGVRKKILNQIQALEDLSNNVILAFCRNDKLIIKNKDELKTININRGLTHYRGSILKWIKKEKLLIDIDTIYIRYPGSIDPTVYLTLKYLNKVGVKVILELPTYPIGGELVNHLKKVLNQKKIFTFVKYLIAYGIHRIMSRKMCRYVSLIVTFMPYDKIWNIDTVCIDNGVNTRLCPTVIPHKNSNQNIVLIGVANIAIWHGYDRIIMGLQKYYDENGSRNIIFNIIGESNTAEKLKELVYKNNLERHVIFKGNVFGNELYDSYNEADIAVSSLGMHRINVLNGSTLKTKEYCSYGLPFILGYSEKTINESFNFALKIEPNDNAVNIEKIVNFYDYIIKFPNRAEYLHQFACDNYEWNVQMEKVIQSLNEKYTNEE